MYETQFDGIFSLNQDSEIPDNTCPQASSTGIISFPYSSAKSVFSSFWCPYMTNPPEESLFLDKIISRFP